MRREPGPDGRYVTYYYEPTSSTSTASRASSRSRSRAPSLLKLTFPRGQWQALAQTVGYRPRAIIHAARHGRPILGGSTRARCPSGHLVFSSRSRPRRDSDLALNRVRRSLRRSTAWPPPPAAAATIVVRVDGACGMALAIRAVTAGSVSCRRAASTSATRRDLARELGRHEWTASGLPIRVGAGPTVFHATSARATARTFPRCAP
jgi:hypothetical protein